MRIIFSSIYKCKINKGNIHTKSGSFEIESVKKEKKYVKFEHIKL